MSAAEWAAAREWAHAQVNHLLATDPDCKRHVAEGRPAYACELAWRRLGLELDVLGRHPPGYIEMGGAR